MIESSKKGKLIILSAPSGSGKSTIVSHLLHQGLNLEFSISATSRKPRGEEKNGVEYYFFSSEEFKQRIDKQEFIEWEEVYSGTYYGTLKSEVERITSHGNNVIFDVDVVGGVNIKKMYGEQAISMFIMPPSVEELRNRLEARGTDTPEAIEKRLAKAEQELTFASQFDKVVVNDNLEVAKEEATFLLKSFLG